MIPKIGDIVCLNEEFVEIYLSKYGDYWVVPFINQKLEVLDVIPNIDNNGNKLDPIYAYYSVRFKIVGASINNPKTRCNIGIDLKGRQHGIIPPVFVMSKKEIWN